MNGLIYCADKQYKVKWNKLINFYFFKKKSSNP